MIRVNRVFGRPPLIASIYKHQKNTGDKNAKHVGREKRKPDCRSTRSPAYFRFIQTERRFRSVVDVPTSRSAQPKQGERPWLRRQELEAVHRSVDIATGNSGVR